MTNTLRATWCTMLKKYKTGKQDLFGQNLFRKWKSETADFWSFWYTFPRVRCLSDLLPSGSNEMKHMKKPYIAPLWAKENQVRCFFMHLFGVSYVPDGILISFV